MNQPAPSPARFNPWPWGLLAFFALLITAIASFVVFALGQDMQLVREDYYEAEIRYQQHLDRARRTHAWQKDIALIQDQTARTLTLQLPETHARAGVSGRVHFYRPSNAALDRNIPLQLSAKGSQVLSVADLAAGLWKVQIHWSANGQEFYTQKSIVLGP